MRSSASSTCPAARARSVTAGRTKWTQLHLGRGRPEPAGEVADLACRCHDEEPRCAVPPEHEVRQLEGRGRRVLHVVEHDENRAPAAERGEERGNGLEGVPPLHLGRGWLVLVRASHAAQLGYELGERSAEPLRRRARRARPAPWRSSSAAPRRSAAGTTIPRPRSNALRRRSHRSCARRLRAPRRSVSCRCRLRRPRARTTPCRASHRSSGGVSAASSTSRPTRRALRLPSAARGRRHPLARLAAPTR